MIDGIPMEDVSVEGPTVGQLENLPSRCTSAAFHWKEDLESIEQDIEAGDFDSAEVPARNLPIWAGKLDLCGRSINPTDVAEDVTQLLDDIENQDKDEALQRLSIIQGR